MCLMPLLSVENNASSVELFSKIIVRIYQEPNGWISKSNEIMPLQSSINSSEKNLATSIWCFPFVYCQSYILNKLFIYFCKMFFLLFYY